MARKELVAGFTVVVLAACCALAPAVEPPLPFIQREGDRVQWEGDYYFRVASTLSNPLVAGTSASLGTAVYGYASELTSETIAICGEVDSPLGWAGYFTGGLGILTDGQFVSTIPTGTAPLSVASTTRVANLNADLLDGLDSTAFWQLGGNAGTTAGTHFLGTRDDEPLELHVHAVRALRLEPAVDNLGNLVPNVIGGHSDNSVSSGVYGATIGGGGYPGLSNAVIGAAGTVSGGLGNTADGTGAAIGGGYGNIADVYASVGGGVGNTAVGRYTTVGGGHSNTASAGYATVPGGYYNTAAGAYSFAAGLRAKANHRGAFVWADSTVGDFTSTAADQFLIRAAGGVGIGTNSPQATLDVAGTARMTGFEMPTGAVDGYVLTVDASGVGTWQPRSVSGWSLTGNTGTNPVTDFVGTVDNQPLELRVHAVRALRLEPAVDNLGNLVPNVIGGHSDNSVSSGVYGATIGGGGYPGTRNAVIGPLGTVSGGFGNRANGSGAAIGGGYGNIADVYATVGGGVSNTAGGSYANVGGGHSNAASGLFATVGGGHHNNVSGYCATVSGGYSNDARNYYATVGGGYGNNAIGSQAAVGGGYRNDASNHYATIGGGYYNAASGAYATVGGGYRNSASGERATVGGGRDNTASGYYAAVAGGGYNTASGECATVGAGALNAASGSYAAVPGGIQNTAAGAYSFAAGHRAKANHDGAFVWADSTAADLTSTADDQFLIRASGGVYLHTNPTLTTGSYLASGSGTWASVSDRAVKENVVPVDAKQVLDRLSCVPISTWNYTTEDDTIRHMGPMAQDLHAAFGLGDSDRSIGTIDAEGVALAAIQGLHQLVKEKDAEIADLKARLARLEALTEKLVQEQAEDND